MKSQIKRDQRVIKLYLEGLKVADICRKTNVSKGTMFKILDKHQVKKRNEGYIPPELAMVGDDAPLYMRVSQEVRKIVCGPWV